MVVKDDKQRAVFEALIRYASATGDEWSVTIPSAKLAALTEDLERAFASQSQEQKLISICFQIAQIVWRRPAVFKKMDQQKFCEWVAQQLRDCGFDTEPVGASWGMLKRKS